MTKQNPEDGFENEICNEQDTESESATEMPGEVDDLTRRLEQAEETSEKFKRLAQRGQADLVNYRNRVISEQEQLAQRILRRTVTRFLVIADQFEHALTQEASNKVDQRWVDGLDAIYQKFLATLGAEGFERFNAIGNEFDPYRHDALSTFPTDAHLPNTVIKQITAGYMHKGDIVRPAQVEIAIPLQEEEGS